MSTKCNRRVIVYHSLYGCDTGCCGHVIEIDDGTPEGREEWTFDHPDIPDDPDFRLWAEEIVRKHGCDPADLDWENCEILDD